MTNVLKQCLAGFAFASLHLPVTAAPPLYKVSNLDVAGVRLGMTPDEVQQVLSGSGYTLSSQRRSLDFAGRVERGAMERRGEHIGPRTRLSGDIGSEGYTGPSSQIVSVIYGPSPTGQGVTDVTYKVQHDYLEEATFFQTVRNKYGPPSQTTERSEISSRSFTYCDTQDVNCRNEAPRLMAIGIYPMSMNHWRAVELREGRVAHQRREAAIAAAVDQVVPKVRAPQF